MITSRGSCGFAALSNNIQKDFSNVLADSHRGGESRGINADKIDQWWLVPIKTNDKIRYTVRPHKTRPHPSVSIFQVFFPCGGKESLRRVHKYRLRNGLVLNVRCIRTNQQPAI